MMAALRLTFNTTCCVCNSRTQSTGGENQWTSPCPQGLLDNSHSFFYTSNSFMPYFHSYCQNLIPSLLYACCNVEMMQDRSWLWWEQGSQKNQLHATTVHFCFMLLVYNQYQKKRLN